VVVAGAAWKPPVCCTWERGFFLLMTKHVEWKLIQEHGVFGVEAYGRAVEVVKVEHEKTAIWSLPSQHGSRRCAVHWNAVVFRSCRKMWNGSWDRSVESVVLKPMEVQWKSYKCSKKKDWNFSYRWDLVVTVAT